MQDIFLNFVRVALKVVRELKIGCLVIIVYLKVWRDYLIILWEKASGLAAVAVGSLGSGAEILVDIEGDAFVYCCVFLRKIVIVLVIRIKILELVGVCFDCERRGVSVHQKIR